MSPRNPTTSDIAFLSTTLNPQNAVRLNRLGGSGRCSADPADDGGA